MKIKGGLSCEILNIPISEFYTFNSNIIDSFNTIELKAILLTYLNQLERVFVGVFGKSFSIKESDDISLFKEVFPLISRLAAKNLGDEGIIKLCSSLSVFRNLNAHSFSYCDYHNEMDLAYILNSIPNYSPYVKYVSDNGIPTLAGMITLLLFLSNGKAISYFIKNDIWNDFIEHLNFFSSSYEPNLYQFASMVENVNQVQFETLIRKDAVQKDIFKAVFGRFSSNVFKENDTYSYINDKELEDSSFNITLDIKTNADGNYEIAVKKGSSYGIYFHKTYSLEVVDLEDFIEKSYKVPPFMFIVYLYKAGISRYTINSLTNNDKEMFIKLNKPKFYVDKNINSLFLPKTISDLRMAGQIVSVNLNYCFLMFEYAIHTRKNLTIYHYSSFRDSLKFLSVPDEIVKQMVSVRNFFAHYYILGDEKIVGSKGTINITIEFILKLYLDFVSALHEIDTMVENDTMKDLYYRLCCNLLLFKYSDILRKTNTFLNYTDEKTKYFEQLSKTMFRIQNSCINKEVEELIKKVSCGRPFYYKERKIQYFNMYVLTAKDPIICINGEKLQKQISFITVNPINPSDYFLFKEYKTKKTQISGYLNRIDLEIE